MPRISITANSIHDGANFSQVLASPSWLGDASSTGWVTRRTLFGASRKVESDGLIAVRDSGCPYILFSVSTSARTVGLTSFHQPSPSTLIEHLRATSLMDQVHALGPSAHVFPEGVRHSFSVPDVPYSEKLTTLAFLLLLSLLLSRSIANRKTPKCVAPSLDVLLVLKIFFGVVYAAAVTCTSLALPHTEVIEWIGAGTQIAASMTFVAASISEHHHSIAPSTLTTLYAVLAAAFYAYTAGRLGPDAPSAAAASLLCLVFLESKNKRTLLIPMDPAPAYESTLSFLIRPFFPHIAPLLYAGSQRRLKLDELREIPLDLQADPATQKLMSALAKGDKKSEKYLFNSAFQAFGGQFLAPVVPRLIVVVATFAQVTLVEQLISYVSDSSISNERGPILILAYFLVYVSLTISNYVYTEKINAFIVQCGSALTGSIYGKTLRLTSMAAREVGQGAATTYMSIDVEKVTAGFSIFHEVWASVIIILVACAMLWIKAGLLVMLAPLLFIISLLGATSVLSGHVGASQKRVMDAIDARVKVLSSVLNQLRPIKLNAYEPFLESKISDLRKIETNALKQFMDFIAAAATLGNMGSYGAFMVTLAAYYALPVIGWGDLPPLTVTSVFTLYTIVSLLIHPLNVIGQTLPLLFASLASITRIQGFLQLPEKAETPAPLVDLDDRTFIKGCTFGWDDSTPVLHGIDLELSPRELHMVVGSVASGKSSLIMSLLGETKLFEGVMKVNAPKVALASQTAFIYPGTLRSNILLDNPFDEAFYDKVIHACGLRQDIEALPYRDLTMLGEKGATLSGGQRQRVALARAVYAQADLVLLDDVFSALDGETEAHVFASLFGGEGMLKDRTVVLVTHAIHHLSKADKVIVMESGRVAHFGSFEQVRAAGATFALASLAVEAKAQVMAEQNSTEATIVDEEKEEEEAWSAEQISRRGAYLFYAKCAGYVQIAILGGFILGWGLANVSAVVYLSFLPSSPGRLGLWVAGYAGVVAINLLFVAMTLLVFARVLSGSTASNVHKAELVGVMESPISWITKNPVGKILNRFSQDIQVADREFPFACMNCSVNILGTLATFLFIALATPLMGLALPILGVFGFYALRFYLKTSKQFRRLELGSKSPLYTLFGTTISGLITVRAYGAQDYFRSQNASFVNKSQGALHHRLAGQLFLRIFLFWFQTILSCSVAILTVSLRSSTSAPILGVALSALVSLGGTMSFMLTSYATVENGSIAIERIQEFANLPKEETLIGTDETKDAEEWPCAGSLAFSDFSMRYRPAAGAQNISFALEGGSKIGICGRTGSGKSSTVLSLFRGIDQHLVTGSIVIDGVDISTVSLKKLRESMSIVTQDPFLWHGSIRENIDVGGEHNDAEIWEVLKHVEMFDAVSALDDKLDHLVVDEESFSKGQRQLLCLARALLRNKKIMVLDESTSSMDHVTDEKIRHVVDSQMKSFTVIAIAHRISTIVNFDKILVLDNGFIAEFEEPQVLLSNPESRFARLAASQGIYHPDLAPSGVAVKGIDDGTVVVVTEDLVNV
ncbi:P-loop containing nucleoside triphosphate hydrolase protein [Roridomyces roridus]|uniref:P-loop containing nucleoside triphosphate hydrolase protein n=1 Tax=Roridomyces roridus TaxID=1738132 RepID=A0AAD7BM98_9AGAR|nr:P-loop containing nucleoside triphosphate hydrolase protein [Roridomyces roridus]